MQSYLYIIFILFRTTEEIQSGELQWPFWTKLVVVAIGFTGEKVNMSHKQRNICIFSGGLVFMYIQCKVYLQICRKWRAYNRTIVVQVRENLEKYFSCQHKKVFFPGSSSRCDKRWEKKDSYCSKARKRVIFLLFWSWAWSYRGKCGYYLINCLQIFEQAIKEKPNMGPEPPNSFLNDNQF